MKIETPCLLGEQFTHNKSWGHPGPRYLVGLELFVWHCNMDGVTLYGSLLPYADNRVDFYHREHLDERTICFEVPDHLLFNDGGTALRELGIEADGMGWVGGLRLDQEGGWRYHVSRGRDRTCLDVRTEALDRLFAPILPAVRMRLYDFL